MTVKPRPRAKRAQAQEPWALWMDYYRVAHAWQMEWYQMWAHYCLPSLFFPHSHEDHHQLEIPDPLAQSKEPELFA